MATYKTAAENRKYNYQHLDFVNHESDVQFLVSYVKSPGETEMKTGRDGKQFESPVGSYKLYNPIDKLEGWIPKWFLKRAIHERTVGTLLGWDDFNPKYTPDTIEWKDCGEYLDKNIQAYNDALAGINRYEVPSSNKAFERDVSPFYMGFNEKELIFLLEKNGWDQAKEDAEFIMEGDPNLTLRDVLIGLCKERNVIPVSEIQKNKPAFAIDDIKAIVHEEIDTIGAVLQIIIEKIDSLTADGVLSLKDLLSKAKIEAKFGDDAS